MHAQYKKKMANVHAEVRSLLFAYMNAFDVRCYRYESGVAKLIALQVEGCLLLNVLLYFFKYSTHRKVFDMKYIVRPIYRVLI